MQGCWANGFGFHFAVADQDHFKDTTTNVEVIARMSESIYKKHSGMPLTLVILQDNTCRECKNQKILKVVGKWVIAKIHKHVWLTYPEKGHSHGPLDAVFGQFTVKLGNEEFDDDEEVVELIQGFLNDGFLELGTDKNAKAYKLDQAAQWVLWAEADLLFQCSKHTGKEAPHSFHVCLRQDLTDEECLAEATAWEGAPPPLGGDLVVALRSNMSDRKAFQVALLAPHLTVERLRRCAQDSGPPGIHPRRPVSQKDRQDMIHNAQKCYKAKAITKTTLDYLTEWCKGTRRQHPRPKEYCFLRHRWSEATAVADKGEHINPSAARYLDPKWVKVPRRITVVKDAKRAKAANLKPEAAEDGGDAPLQILPG